MIPRRGRLACRSSGDLYDNIVLPLRAKIAVEREEVKIKQRKKDIDWDV